MTAAPPRPPAHPPPAGRELAQHGISHRKPDPSYFSSKTPLLGLPAYSFPFPCSNTLKLHVTIKDQLNIVYNPWTDRWQTWWNRWTRRFEVPADPGPKSKKTAAKYSKLNKAPFFGRMTPSIQQKLRTAEDVLNDHKSACAYYQPKTKQEPPPELSKSKATSRSRFQNLSQHRRGAEFDAEWSDMDISDISTDTAEYIRRVTGQGIESNMESSDTDESDVSISTTESVYRAGSQSIESGLQSNNIINRENGDSAADSARLLRDRACLRARPRLSSSSRSQLGHSSIHGPQRRTRVGRSAIQPRKFNDDADSTNKPSGDGGNISRKDRMGISSREASSRSQSKRPPRPHSSQSRPTIQYQDGHQITNSKGDQIEARSSISNASTMATSLSKAYLPTDRVCRNPTASSSSKHISSLLKRRRVGRGHRSRDYYRLLLQSTREDIKTKARQGVGLSLVQVLKDWNTSAQEASLRQIIEQKPGDQRRGQPTVLANPDDPHQLWSLSYKYESQFTLIYSPELYRLWSGEYTSEAVRTLHEESFSPPPIVLWAKNFTLIAYMLQTMLVRFCQGYSEHQYYLATGMYRLPFPKSSLSNA